MEIENQVQFTHVTQVLVQYFHKCMDHLKHNQFVFILIDDRDKIQWSVSFVYDFVIFVFDEVACLRFTSNNQLINLICIKNVSTSLRKRCFSCWEMLLLYHLVRRDLPWRLMRKKQWIMFEFIINLKKWIKMIWM